MVHQRDEYAGSATGTPSSLDSAAASLHDLEAALDQNKAEPELECTVIVHLANQSLARLERHAESLQAQFEPANYGLVRPIGDQSKLLAMMWPGSAATPPVSDYRQHLLARDLASMLPFNGSEIGDRRGGLLGVNLDSGVAQPVLSGLSEGPRRQMPGNFGGVGEPGSGKSATGKRFIELVCAADGQVVTIDRTEQREYARYAAALHKMGVATQVVEIGADTGTTLDPLRVFGPAERVTVTVGFLAQLCMVETGSLEAMALAEAVDAVSARNGRLTDVADELARQANNGAAEASVLARKLARFARLDELGRSVFGDGEPLRMDAGFVVFSVAGLDLPSRETLENEHLSKRMLDSQVAAQALLYIVAAFARRATFANRSRFAVALLDEWWGIGSSPYGRALIREWLRDSRKHNAAVGLFSQHADDFDDEVRSFLGTRMVFRQRTINAARAALEFLDVVDDEMVERLTSSNLDEGGFASGTCLLRDLDNRVGLIQVHQSFNPDLREASDTNPTPSRRTTDATAAADARHVVTVMAARVLRVLLAVIAAIVIGQLAAGAVSAQTPPDQPPVTVPDDPNQPTPTPPVGEPTVPSPLPTVPSSTDEGPLPDGDSLIPALPAETLTHPTMNYDIGYDEGAWNNFSRKFFGSLTAIGWLLNQVIVAVVLWFTGWAFGFDLIGPIKGPILSIAQMWNQNLIGPARAQRSGLVHLDVLRGVPGVAWSSHERARRVHAVRHRVGRHGDHQRQPRRLPRWRRAHTATGVGGDDVGVTRPSTLRRPHRRARVRRPDATAAPPRADRAALRGHQLGWTAVGAVRVGGVADGR